MAEVLYCSKSKKNMHLGFSFISKQVLLGFHSIENTKIKYDWGLNLFKMIKQGLVEPHIAESTKVR